MASPFCVVKPRDLHVLTSFQASLYSGLQLDFKPLALTAQNNF